MSFSSLGVSIPEKKFSEIAWADSGDHTKIVGNQAMGFYQWNVNLFFAFPTLILSYGDEVDYEKPYNITDTGTITLQVIDSNEAVYTSASTSFTYKERKWGKVKKDKDGNKTYEWNYEYETQITALSFGAEKFTTFNGIKLIVDCKAKKKQQKETRVASIKSASVLWFRAVPTKNMADLAYSTDFTTREVFHFGKFNDKASEDQAAAEKKGAAAAKAATDAANNAVGATSSLIGF